MISVPSDPLVIAVTDSAIMDLHSGLYIQLFIYIYKELTRIQQMASC